MCYATLWQENKKKDPERTQQHSGLGQQQCNYTITEIRHSIAVV